MNQYSFTVTTGDCFILDKEIGNRGEAFRVVSEKGQLGHIQKELVAHFGALWPPPHDYKQISPEWYVS